MKESIKTTITSGTRQRLENRFYHLKEWPEFKHRTELIEAMIMDVLEHGFRIDTKQLAEAIRSHEEEDECE